MRFPTTHSRKRGTRTIDLDRGIDTVVGVRPKAGAHVEPIGGRNLHIEALRGIAALAVVGYHLAAVTRWPRSFPPRLLLSNGDAGVTLFFVLSGFLLWRPFAAAVLNGERMPNARQYLVNRFLRIVPACWVALVVTMMFLGGRANGGAWRYFLFAQNYSKDSFFGVISPAWSLVLEMHFYLALPAVGFIAAAVAMQARDRAGRARVLYGVVGLWFAASFGYKLFALGVQHREPSDVMVWFNFPAKAHLFAFGMLLATWHAIDRRRGPIGRRISKPVAWLVPAAGATIVAAAVAVRYRSPLTQIMFDTATAAGFMLLVYPVAFSEYPKTFVSRLTSRRALQRTGESSYSLYLWHHPLIGFMAAHGILRASMGALLPNMAITLLVCVGVALVSYRFVEKPFLTLRRRWDVARPTKTIDLARGTVVDAAEATPN
jgi:peptidoglycan/LPS O-acetylase OafA/YrhL